MPEKLTKARRIVLSRLVKRPEGKATQYDLAYPRSNMMHTLFMAGMVTIEGETNAWGEPSGDGLWVITDAGRAALASVPK